MRIVILQKSLALMLMASLTACTLLSGSSKSAEDHFASAPQKALVQAALRGNAKGIDEALAQGADINKIGIEGATPLLLTIWRDRMKGMRLLLERGADPSLISPRPPALSPPDIHTPIQATLSKSSPDYLRVLLENGANPDSLVGSQASNFTALFFSIRNRKTTEFTRLLIEHGANVNHQSRYGNTPILQAVSGSRYPQALLLLEAGADPELGSDPASWPPPLPPGQSKPFTTITSIRIARERDLGHLKRGAFDMVGYQKFIEALKARGYLEADF